MERLFERMRTDRNERAALLKECVARLSAHSWAEEERVYPVIVKADPPEEGQVYHGVEEHHEAEALLHKLEELDPSSAEWDNALDEFVSAVKHHVEEEETKILPALAEAVDRSRLAQLGAAFEERRRAILTEQGFGTRDELYEQARQAGVAGRSGMTKEELARAVRGSS